MICRFQQLRFLVTDDGKESSLKFFHTIVCFFNCPVSCTFSFFIWLTGFAAIWFSRIVSVISYYKNQLTSIDLWREWIGKLAAGAALFGAKFSGVEVASLKDQADEGESPAIEVLKYREPQGYFAGFQILFKPFNCGSSSLRIVYR